MRIKALILAFILLLSYAPPTGYALNIDDTAFMRAESFLSQLGITKGIEKSEIESIDRASFAAMIVRGLNYTTKPSDTSQFIDCKENQFNEEIHMAKDLGIVNGTSPVTFSPDSGIAPAAAAKMLVSALGYGEKAEAMGGYPHGYLNIATSMDLFDDVDMSVGAISVKDAFILVYNMLYADKAIITTVIDNEFIFETIEGRNLLTDNFGYLSVSGVITTAGFYGTDVTLTGRGKIGIGTKIFSSDLINVSEYLGLKAKIWYDDSEKKAYAVDIDSVNECFSFVASDFMEYENDTIIIDNGTGKEKKYRCDSLTFIQNGASIPFTGSSFIYDNGEITLIDNDGDGKIEFAVSKLGEYFIIKSKNVIDAAIYDGNSNLGSVIFENEDDCDYSIIIDGREATFDDLKSGMSAQIYMRYDRKYCEVVALSGQKTAVVTEIATDGVFLDGEKYKLNSYFTSRDNKLSAGNTYKFYMAPDGTISDIVRSDYDNERYGILLGFNVETGLSGKAKIKILTTDDEVVVFDIADKVIIDGTRRNCDDEFVKSVMTDTLTDIPNYQLIKYKTSSDGRISSIDTADNDENNWNIEAHKSENNTLTKYVWNKELYFRDGYAIPHVYMLGATIFRVPEDFDLKDSNQAVKKLYDDDEFGILTVSDFADGEKVDVDAFDFDANFAPSVVLVRRDATSQVTRNDSSYIVTKVSENASDNEGNPAVKLYTFAGGIHKEFFIEPEDYAAYSQKPSAGDIVRFRTKEDDYISSMHIAVFFNGMTKNDKATVNYKSPVVEAVHGSLTYIIGTVYNTSDNFIVVNENLKSAGSYWFKSPTGTLSLPLANTEFIFYNQRTQIAKTVSRDKLISSLHTGNGSFVVCECMYGQVIKVYLYEY